MNKRPQEHGGSLARGRRKTARPILRHKKAIAALLDSLADKHKVRVYSFANVGNHLHLVVSVHRREALKNFMRVFTQVVMFAVTGARKGAPKGKFWDTLYYSRVARWGREFSTLKRYLAKNKLESLGFSRGWVDRIFLDTVNIALEESPC
jgi:REP element-mobilizing transposase RayT